MALLLLGLVHGFTLYQFAPIRCPRKNRGIRKPVCNELLRSKAVTQCYFFAVDFFRALIDHNSTGKRTKTLRVVPIITSVATPGFLKKEVYHENQNDSFACGCSARCVKRHCKRSWADKRRYWIRRTRLR